MNTQVLDPLTAAVSDAENAGQYFGKIDCEGQYVVLKKGEKKRAWLDGESTEGRTTQVTLRLNPLDCTGMTNFIERQVLSNSQEFSRTVWPSLRELGAKDLAFLRGKWAKVSMVKNGRKWNNQNGEEVEGTTFKFLAVYNTEAEAITAWEAQFGGNVAHTPSSNGTNGNGAPSPVNDAEKAAAAQFLPHIVSANKNDLDKLAAMLASMSPINKYFTVDSPEVQVLLKAA